MPILRRTNGNYKIVLLTDIEYKFSRLNPINGYPVASEWGVICNSNGSPTPYGVSVGYEKECHHTLIDQMQGISPVQSTLLVSNDDVTPLSIKNKPKRAVELDKTSPFVSTYDGKQIKREDSVYSNSQGFYAHKDDPNLCVDFFTKGVIINDVKRFGELCRVATKIDKKGKFSDFQYSTAFSGDYNLAVGRTIYGDIFDPLLTLTDEFKNIYEEDLNSGSFVIKGNSKPFVKGKKVLYRKTTCKSNSFKKSVENKPMTYKGTFGKKYSFGIELETCSGTLPAYLDAFIFYSAVHDGSLRHADDGKVYGGEYVTDVLRGDLGLSNLKMLCTELTKRCLVDKTCGVHVHIGDAIFDKETVVLMYYLYVKIQDEIFMMLPPSRRNNEYCRKLPNIGIDLSKILSERDYHISFYYDRIIQELSNFSGGQKVNKKRDHPKGAKCGYDHSTARYCWVNFMPTVFNTRKNGIYTVEFRPAPGSTSYIKVKNWLLICFALVDIVENYKAVIYSNPNITLYEILDICYPTHGKNLIEWVERRKQKFSNADVKVEAEEYLENEIDEDRSLKKV